MATNREVLGAGSVLGPHLVNTPFLRRPIWVRIVQKNPERHSHERTEAHFPGVFPRPRGRLPGVPWARSLFKVRVCRVFIFQGQGHRAKPQPPERLREARGRCGGAVLITVEMGGGSINNGR